MSLTGFRARNHPQQSAIDEVDDRAVPAELFGKFHRRWRFTVDAAASTENAMLPRYWTRQTDGLAQDWTTERVWCNPPYSACEAWITKAWAEHRRGCPLVVMLVPANRTEQPWWQAHIEPYRDKVGCPLRTEFLATRIRFIYPRHRHVPALFDLPAASHANDRPPFGSVLLIWDES